MNNKRLTSNSRREEELPILSGILPDIELKEDRNTCSELSSPIVCGMDPSIELREKSMIEILVNNRNSSGSVPFRLLETVYQK